MRKSFCLLALLSFLPAYSIQAEEGFFEPRELSPSQRPEFFENALRASVRHFSGGHAAGGSAFVVSNSGYVITTLHSLPALNCATPFLSLSEDRDQTYRLLKPLTQEPRDVYCDGLSIPELNATRPKVVYLGRGATISLTKAIFKYDRADFDKIVSANGDFVVLKYSLKKLAPCVPLANSRIAAGEPLWAIGYPFISLRGRRPLKPSTEYVSFGRAYAEGFHPGLEPRESLNDDQREQLRSWEKESKEIISSADATNGNSGGVVVDMDGQWAGVVTRVYKENDSKNHDSVWSGFLRSQAIYEEISNNLGDAVARQIFDCRVSR